MGKGSWGCARGDEVDTVAAVEAAATVAAAPAHQSAVLPPLACISVDWRALAPVLARNADDCQRLAGFIVRGVGGRRRGRAGRLRRGGGHTTPQGDGVACG